MKRFIAVFLTLCLVLGMGSVSAFAATVGDSWKYEQSLPIKIQNNTTASLNGKIYVIGGLTGTASLDKMYSMDKDGQWEEEANLPEGTSNAQSIAVKEKIYVVGGTADKGSNGCKNVLMIYDSKTELWTYGAPIPTPTHSAGVAAIGDKIYVFGGRIDVRTNKSNVYIYDINLDKWEEAAPMPRALYGLRAEPVGDKIYVMGGFKGQPPAAESAVNIYDIKTNTWADGTAMPFSTAHFGTVAIANKIYVFGGYHHGPINKTAVYNIDENIWTVGSDLPTNVYVHGAGIANNKIYSIGGSDKNLATIATVMSLNIQKLKLYVLLSESEQVQLSISHNLANNSDFTWSSTDEAVATVDESGKVTAVAAGEADIYAKSDDGTFSEYIPVKVVEGMADELRLAVHLNTGENAKLYLAEEASTVTWSSMDESIATISTDGEVTAVGRGLAIVKAELDGETYQVYVRVNS